MREQILKEIRRLADANSGQPPGSRTFTSETGIGVKQWHGVYWARWSEAVAEAGLQPNEATEKRPTSEIFEMLALSIRQFKRLPTKMEFRLYRKTHPELPTDRTIDKRFGSGYRFLLAPHEQTRFRRVHVHQRSRAKQAVVHQHRISFNMRPAACTNLTPEVAVPFEPFTHVVIHDPTQPI